MIPPLSPARLLAFAIVTLASFLGPSCTSPAKAERSAAITATGDASIENWVVKGLTTTRIFVFKVDGEVLQPRGRRGVYPLSPGVHELTIYCQFTRMAVMDLMIDAGETALRLDAKPGTRYRLRTQKHSKSSALVWIEEVATGTPVTKRVTVALAENPQNVPTVILIPI